MFSDNPTIWTPDTRPEKIASLKTLLGNDNNVNEFDFTDKQTQNIMDLISHQHNQTLPNTLNPFGDKNIVVPDE